MLSTSLLLCKIPLWQLWVPQSERIYITFFEQRLQFPFLWFRVLERNRWYRTKTVCVLAKTLNNTIVYVQHTSYTQNLTSRMDFAFIPSAIYHQRQEEFGKGAYVKWLGMNFTVLQMIFTLQSFIRPFRVGHIYKIVFVRRRNCHFKQL